MILAVGTLPVPGSPSMSMVQEFLQSARPVDERLDQSAPELSPDPLVFLPYLVLRRVRRPVDAYAPEVFEVRLDSAIALMVLQKVVGVLNCKFQSLALGRVAFEQVNQLFSISIGVFPTHAYLVGLELRLRESTILHLRFFGKITLIRNAQTVV
jgi:hypothetical protein